MPIASKVKTSILNCLAAAACSCGVGGGDVVGIVTRALRSKMGAKTRRCSPRRRAHLYMGHLLSMTGALHLYKSEPLASIDDQIRCCPSLVVQQTGTFRAPSLVERNSTLSASRQLPEAMYLPRRARSLLYPCSYRIHKRAYHCSKTVGHLPRQCNVDHMEIET